MENQLQVYIRYFAPGLRPLWRPDRRPTRPSFRLCLYSYSIYDDDIGFTQQAHGRKFFWDNDKITYLTTSLPEVKFRRILLVSWTPPADRRHVLRNERQVHFTLHDADVGITFRIAFEVIMNRTRHTWWIPITLSRFLIQSINDVVQCSMFNSRWSADVS